jgi:DMSO/TMAO reductase YedYZ molybdopterin-dependent catalytic subunit
LLTSFITDDSDLFETIHMGAAVVDKNAWRLVVDGLVDRPFSIDLEILKSLPLTTITSFHECYGSPLKMSETNLLRVGNVKWTGVRLSLLLKHAGVQPGANFVWSEGLDSGSFAGKQIDVFRKDLPIEKALSDEVLVAFAMNGEPLRKERGGPVRLVVPGWFGTNMTKWLSRLSVQSTRAAGHFTTTWYNEAGKVDGKTVQRPVWEAAPNSLIARPADGSSIGGSHIDVMGWAWSEKGVVRVEVSADAGVTWKTAIVDQRQEFEWQRFECCVSWPDTQPKSATIMARSFNSDGKTQPLFGARNAVHRVTVNQINPSENE